jgi:hypothetical protein
MTALQSWAAAAAEEAKVTAQRRDADGPMVDRALEIVRRFIVERRLILFGGLAIDYALRLKGSRIYPDDERPDFDFLSPRSVDDAYDLVDILAAAGLRDVGAIRAIHVQTMRVRTSFVYVADIGYAPPAVFDRIPTLEWKGMRVVHPDFQRMDQHLAFCFPFNGPPLEDVRHRWRKDLKRFNLLSDHWPVAAPTPAGGGRRVVGRVAARADVALHGFAAYAVLRSSLDDLAAAFGQPAPKVAAPRLAIDVSIDNGPAVGGSIAFDGAETPLSGVLIGTDCLAVGVETPVGDAVHFAAADPDAALAGAGTATVYYPYMDICPEIFRAGSTSVASVRKRLLAVSRVRVGKVAVRVVSPAYLLLFFLFEAFRAGSPADADVYRGYYLATLEVLDAAEAMFAAAAGLPADAGPQKLPGPLADLYAASPFAPTVQTMGDINQDAAYLIKMATAAEKVGDTPPAVLNLDPDLAARLVGLPRNYYGRGDRPAFDYDASPLFRRDGRVMSR